MICHEPPTPEVVAKRLECDDDKARFEGKLGNLAKQKAADK